MPEAATPVVETSARGSITPQASLTPITSDLRELTAARCENGLLTIETSLETIYAKLSCDLFSSDQFNQHFTGKPAALVLEVSPNRYRILITTVDGAHAEFTPDAIWVQ